MIWHNDVTGNLAAFLFHFFKPKMEVIINFSFFKQGKPLVTGKCDKIKGGIFLMLPMCGHDLKIKRTPTLKPQSPPTRLQP